MKKALLIVMTAFTLSGCMNSNEESSDEQVQQKSQSGNVHAESNDKKETYSNNPQAPDTRSLKEVGEEFRDEDGKVILKAISDYHETHMIGPIELTISNVKVMDYIPAYHLIDFFHGYTHNETNFTYVKFHVTLNNTSEESVNFAPISVLETNEGEIKDFEDDFYLQNLNGTLSANERKSGELAFILDKTAPDKLTEITVTTSDVFDKNNESIQKGSKIEIAF
ncbi:membrane lipoprotein lipid attachment site-containing protein [Salinibacillus aidingensis]|uniref:Membrane lipoprotein lipid attachment site-containing protein n=1 Tax=Salinibacillus aidingensis TaxID=237684 RepID=A0ABP3KXQ4_9BACI